MIRAGVPAWFSERRENNRSSRSPRPTAAKETAIRRNEKSPIRKKRLLIVIVGNRRIAEMAKGDDIQARLIDFARGAMDICDLLPKTTAGNHIAGQMLRSATSAASNYAEARGAESKSDFIHKEVWLELILTRNMIAGDLVAHVLEECKILCRIVAASRRTARNGRQHSTAETDQPENCSG